MRKFPTLQVSARVKDTDKKHISIAVYELLSLSSHQWEHDFLSFVMHQVCNLVPLKNQGWAFKPTEINDSLRKDKASIFAKYNASPYMVIDFYTELTPIAYKIINICILQLSYFTH